MTELLASAGEILTWLMSLVTQVFTTITGTPLLFAFVLLSLVGSGIFLAIRIIRKLGVRRG